MSSRGIDSKFIAERRAGQEHDVHMLPPSMYWQCDLSSWTELHKLSAPGYADSIKVWLRPGQSRHFKCLSV